MKKPTTSAKRDIKDGTDWEWLDKATDADIDFSDIPPLDDDFFKNAVLRMPRTKKMVSIRLDEELIDWYKHQGPGYQTRINAVLQAYMTASQEAAEDLAKAVKIKPRAPRTARQVLKAPKPAKSRKSPKISESRKGPKVRAAAR